MKFRVELTRTRDGQWQADVGSYLGNENGVHNWQILGTVVASSVLAVMGKASGVVYRHLR